MSGADVEIRRLNAGRGWLWVKQGWQLILRNPLMAVALGLAGALCVILALSLPQIGPIVAMLLMPVMIAGYSRVCRSLEEDEEVELAQLFAGFHTHPARLLTIGSFVMVGMLFASMTMLWIGGDALAQLLQDIQAGGDPQKLANAMWAAGSQIALSLVVGFSLMFLAVLALQYAPMLVFFSDLTAVEALRASLAGSLRNLIPYTVYSLIMQLLAVPLGLLPFGLGLVVWMPLAFTSLYVSYRNIFPFPGELDTPRPSVTETEETQP